MRVLNLVTTPDHFFAEQVRVLKRNGVTVDTVSVPGDAPRSASSYLRFYPQVLGAVTNTYDVVHANYGLTAPFALAQPQRPVVLSLWGGDLMGEYQWLSKRCARHCAATIVMTEEMNQILDTPATVIPHGVDLQRFEPQPQRAAQQAVGWDPEATHILFPYSPDRTVKNYPLAKRVVDSVRPTHDGRLELHVLDGVAHDRMSAYMNAADLLLFTSRREGSPNVIKEALACNLPIVSTDVGDVRKRLAGVSPSAVCRSEAELVTAVERVLADGRRSNGRETVSALSLERMGDRLIEIYESVTDATAGEKHSSRTRPSIRSETS